EPDLGGLGRRDERSREGGVGRRGTRGVDPAGRGAPPAGRDRPARADPGIVGYRAGLRAGAVFALPTFVLAVSFGVLARQLGWGVVAPVVASAVVFSGSAQFAIADVLGAGGGGAPRVVAGRPP